MWFKYLLFILLTIEPLAVISNIGVERKPVSKGTAVMQVILSGLLLLGIVHYWK